jgi:hypothetical protein
VDLAYTEEFTSMDEAIRREHQLKRWSGQKKAALIEGDFATLKRLAKRRKQSASSRRPADDADRTSKNGGSRALHNIRSRTAFVEPMQDGVMQRHGRR